MLNHITRLINYFSSIGDVLPLYPAPLVVATEDQGTRVLNSPSRINRQIVIAFPQSRFDGDCNKAVGQHTFIIFVLEKGKEQNRTQEDSLRLYSEALSSLDIILEKFMGDLSGSLGLCPLLSGLDFVQAEIIPEAGRFGGWDGWSATITLK